MWTAICLTRAELVIGSDDVITLRSGTACGTSTALVVSGAAAMPVPIENGTVAEPWSADRPSESLTLWPQSSAGSSCTPNGVVLAAAPAKGSVGNDEVGCGMLTLGELVDS